MKTVQLPNTSLVSSGLGLGTASFGTSLDQRTSFAMLDAWLECGGTMIDTANAYANWIPGERSLSEKTIGLWMHSRSTRGQVLLATKGANPEPGHLHEPRLARADILGDLEASLNNLQCDYIDLYYLHRDDPSRCVGEIIETLNEAVRSGKVRYLGCSNWQLERIQSAQAYTAERGLQGFSANQLFWNVAVVDYASLGDDTIAMMDVPTADFHRRTEMAAVAYSAQANGYFSKMAADPQAELRKSTRNNYDTPTNRERLARILQLAGETGLSVTQIVLGYVLGQPFTSLALVGPRDLTQLHDAATAGDVELSAEQIRFIETGSQ
ncbi:MAG: aldo/keto reductase [Chloroflexi bacterium]|nr:aldo/keto reductase [Chloroflexota bacterium]